MRKVIVVGIILGIILCIMGPVMITRFVEALPLQYSLALSYAEKDKEIKSKLCKFMEDNKLTRHEYNVLSDINVKRFEEKYEKEKQNTIDKIKAQCEKL